MMMSEFTKGNVQITLSQEDMAKAVEYWLNERIFKQPCTVIKMFESRVNTRSTFEITLDEGKATIARAAAGES